MAIQADLPHIYEKGERLNLTNEQLDYLLGKELIYKCIGRYNEYYSCGKNTYHVATEFADFDDPLAAMGEILNDR